MGWPSLGWIFVWISVWGHAESISVSAPGGRGSPTLRPTQRDLTGQRELINSNMIDDEVAVGEGVVVGVPVWVALLVLVSDAEGVGVSEGVRLGVWVWVLVGDMVGVAVGVGVLLAVAVGVVTRALLQARDWRGWVTIAQAQGGWAPCSLGVQRGSGRGSDVLGLHFANWDRRP